MRPGGLLLAVYHDLDDDHHEHMKSKGVDPADYVGADDLGRLLTSPSRFTRSSRGFTPPPDTPHIDDVVGPDPCDVGPCEQILMIGGWLVGDEGSAVIDV